MATFSDLRIDTAGLGYTLTARSPNLSSATSSAFNVTTPVPIRLPRRPIPDPLYGVTIDAIDHLPAILTSLSSLSRTATTRVVFDEFVPPSDYVDAVSQISRVSYVPCASPAAVHRWAFLVVREARRRAVDQSALDDLQRRDSQ